tara:strand:- start:636 stop:1466 length:831 start_codon:yes stop_codon:yes gene_type:complete
MDFAKLFTPGMGGALNFGMSILNTSAQKAGQYTQAWNKWSQDSINAIRQAAEEDKQNFRQHTVDMKNYLKSSIYVSDLRQYENKLKSDSAQLKTETSINATNALGREYADLNARFYEDEAADTMALETIKQKSISDSVKKISGGQVGRSVERMYNTYNQQYLANASNKLITRDFRIGDKLSAMRAANIDAANKANAVRLYNPRPYQDPIKPDAPIPTEVYMPMKPNLKSGLSFTDIAGAAMGAYNNYMDNKTPAQTGGTTEAAPESPSTEGEGGEG